MIKTTVKISDMTCSMCEAHMNDCIRNNFNVKKVSSSHKKGETVIIGKEPIDEQKLRSVITDMGYTVTGVESCKYEKKGLFG